MSDESDFDIVDIPQVAESALVSKSIEEIQRKEIAALRRQVLEKGAENSILSARVRDSDELFSRRLNEQVLAQSATREKQLSDIETAKREMASLRKKNSFLEMENKALVSKRGSGSDVSRQSSLGDGFIVKRRKPEPDFDILQMDQQFRVEMSNCTLFNDTNALKLLGTEIIAATLSLMTAEATANYLIECLLKLEVYLHPACLKIVQVLLPFVDIQQLNFQPLIQATTELLSGLEALPAFDQPGNIYLSRHTCYSLTSILYALDLLLLCSKPAPYLLVEKLIRNRNAVLCVRGYKLLELVPNDISERNIMTDPCSASFKPELELLFGGLLGERPLDATTIPEFSTKLLQLDIPKRHLAIICRKLSAETKMELKLHIVRSISVKQEIEPSVWYKVAAILLDTEEHSTNLVKTCVRFIWSHSPLPTSSETALYATLLTPKLSRIASLTQDPDVSFWCQNALTQIISPHEDEILREMMSY